MPLWKRILQRSLRMQHRLSFGVSSLRCSFKLRLPHHSWRDPKLRRMFLVRVCVQKRAWQNFGESLKLHSTCPLKPSSLLSAFLNFITPVSWEHAGEERPGRKPLLELGKKGATVPSFPFLEDGVGALAFREADLSFSKLVKCI